MEQIVCTELTLGYGGKEVSHGVNFHVAQGDYLCIVGENGAGKSTLMKALLGLNPPLAGTIEFKNGLRQNEIGYLPQQSPVQKDFPASVQEVVVSGCLARSGIRPFYNAKEKALARENMEKLGISHLARRCYRELSGGQRQRVLLARALCATSRLILLDEPVSGLDPSATADMYALIRKLNREEGTSVIMISHDVSAAVREASHILHLANVPRFFGKVEDYVCSEAGRAFLAAGEEEK